jgi:hypothetical protein
MFAGVRSVKSHLLSVVLICLAGLPSALGQTPAPAKAPHRDILVPSKGAYLGAWVYRGSSDEMTVLGNLESQIGRTFGIGLHYYGWRMQWPNTEMRDDLANNRIPLVSWNCGDRNENVAAGQDDDIIIARARAAKEFGRPIFLRWYWEFNVPAGQHTGACLELEAPLEKKQQDFIAAWRRIWTLFQREGATNVIWVWNPNSTVPPGALDPRGFYPGDQYVDWIAWDKYDQQGGTPFKELFADFIEGYGRMGKPLLIGETGAHPQFQASFLAQAAAAIKGPYSQIKAIVYFDAPGHRKLPWTLSPDGIAALKKLGEDPYFQAMQQPVPQNDSKAVPQK